MPGDPKPPHFIHVIGNMVDEAAKTNEDRAGSPGVGDKPPKRDLGGVKPRETPLAKGSGDEPGTFYLYVDQQGTEHIVDSLELVPNRFRKVAKRWVMPVSDGDRALDDQFSDGFSDIAKTVGNVTTPADSENREQVGSSDLHVPSLLIGVVGGAALFLGFIALRQKTRSWMKVLLFVAIAALVSIAYFGWVRRQAGLTTEPLARPAEVLEDARRAAGKLDEHHRSQEKMIEEIDSKPEQIFFP